MIEALDATLRPLCGTEDVNQRHDQHEPKARIEHVDAPVVVPEGKQCREDRNGPGYRKEPARHRTMPIPANTVRYEGEDGKGRNQLAEEKALVAGQKAEAESGTQRAKCREAPGTRHCGKERAEAAGLIK